MSGSDQTGTMRIARTLKAPRARVFKAFIDGWAMAKWSPPHGWVGQVHESDPTVGGRYRMSFRELDTGAEHAFGGTYVEIDAPSRLVYTDAFETDAEAMQGTMTTTVTIGGEDGAAELSVVQAGIPAAIPVEMAHAGWTQSLELLAQLVEFDAAAP